MTTKLKKILIVVVAIFIVMFAYYMFSNKKAEETTLLTSQNSEMSQKNKVLSQKISKTLAQIKSIELKKDIFSNQVYLSLVDRRVKLDSQFVGRKNPFAPLSDTSVNYKSKTNPEEGDGSVENSQSNIINNLNVTTGTSSTSSVPRNASTTVGTTSSTVRSSSTPN